MKTLQASMILKDEEKMLPRALDSLKGIDSIMICDTGSSDSSFEIYEEYKKKEGYNLTWFKYSKFDTKNHIKDFSHARNECKEKCTGDWLFILDGDEHCMFEIAKVKKMINSSWVGKYDVLLCEVKTKLETTDQPRIFRNIPELWYFRAYHNTLSWFPEGPANPGDPVATNKYYKTALSITADYSPNHKKFPHRTRTIIEETLKLNPMDYHGLYYLGREYLQEKEPLKAFFYFMQYIEIAPRSPQLADVYFIIATIYTDQRMMNKALEYAFKCATMMPSYKNAWILIHELSNKGTKPYWEAIIKRSDNKDLIVKR